MLVRPLNMLYAEAAYTSFASMVIFVLSSLEMGQFSFCVFRHILQTWQHPGRVRWQLLPGECWEWRPLSKVIMLFVSMLVGVKPAPEMMKLSFMLKQPACAAATSSSGLVPAPSSKAACERILGICSVRLFVLKLCLFLLYRCLSNWQMRIFS